MRKGLLIRYIAGEANDTERKQVLDWVDNSPHNKEYFITLKNTWVSQNIPLERGSAEDLEALRESIFALDKIILPGNMLPNGKKTPDIVVKTVAAGRRFKIATFISAAVAVVAIGLLLTRPSVGTMEQQYKEGLIVVAMRDYPAEFKKVIYTERGVKGFIVLPDSSKVWLNSDTKIVFPEKFIGATREVELEGEAYFSVVSDSLRPMIVSTKKGMKIKVMGTEFNLRSYDNEERVVASLYSGKIDLLYGGSAQKEGVKRIQPNEQAMITGNLIKIVTPKAIADHAAWKEGRLIFDSAKMEDVVKELERWHGVEIVVEDPKILSYSISATFNAESIVQIMDMIKYCILIDYRVESNKVYIFGR